MKLFPAGAPFTEIRIKPFWRIVPPDAAPTEDSEDPQQPGQRILLNAGAGFGTGSHETTQLCLQALGLMYPRAKGQEKDQEKKQWRMLDFGSGSGILSIGAAKLGAQVDAIEIEEEAIANGNENAELNGMTDRIQTVRSLEEVDGKYDLVIANVLRPILLEFAPALTARLETGGTLILSGLVGTDVPEVSVRFASLLQGQMPEVYERGDWRALVWKERGQSE